MKKYIKKYLVLLCCMGALLLYAPENESAVSTRNKIVCEYLDDGSMVISGNGILQWEHLEAASQGEVGKGIEEIVIDEGIIGIDSYCFASDFSELRTVELPDTVESIGKKAFKDCTSLTKIKLPDGITEIAEGCFEGCKNLTTVNIPDTVVSIQKDAFMGCERIRKLVLPVDLEQWIDPIADTPMLKKVKNRSNIDCELNDCSANKTWYVGKKKKVVTVVPAGKTAKATGKRYKITYDLLGGKKNGKLPANYEYGSNMKLPTNVKKKGYALLGWYNEAEMDVYYRTEISPAMAEKVTLQPFWVKYKVKNVKGKKIQVTIDDSDAVMAFGTFVVRYSENKDMSNAKICKAPLSSTKKVIFGLKKNMKYYVEISYVDLQENDSERIWVGRQGVRIRK